MSGNTGGPPPPAPPAPPIPRITIDPHLLTCPDFTLPAFDDTRAAVVAHKMITDAEAVQALTDSWTAQNDLDKVAWLAQVAADRILEEEAERLRKEQVEKDREAAAQAVQDGLQAIRDKRPKLGVFDPNASVPDFIDARIPAFAEEKLKAKKWVALYYFTLAAAQEASRSRHATNPETMSWVTNDSDPSGSSFSLAPSVEPSKKAVADRDLAPIDFDYASSNYLRQIRRLGWNDDHCTTLTNFFFHIKNHPIRGRQEGVRATQRYADEVRQEWHNCMANGEMAFNIAIVNESLLERHASQVIRDDAHAKTVELELTIAEARRGRQRDASPAWRRNALHRTPS
ncbi:hypothetical protein BDZ89DRAFT_1022748, partial [Hymenopellis radicata]